MAGGGILKGQLFSGANALQGRLFAGADDQPVYTFGAVTDSELEQDDVNTIAAALEQAASTGKNATVTLTDGSQLTAFPDGTTSQDQAVATAKSAGASVPAKQAASSAATSALDQAKAKAGVGGLLSGNNLLYAGGGLLALAGVIGVVRHMRKRKAKRNPRRRRLSRLRRRA